MTKDDMEGRIMVLENTIKYTLPRIEEYMKNGNDLRIQAATQLATLSSSVTQANKYQEQCEIDRKAHDVRIKVLENARSYSMGRISTYGALSGALVGWFTRHFNL